MADAAIGQRYPNAALAVHHTAVVDDTVIAHLGGAIYPVAPGQAFVFRLCKDGHTGDGVIDVLDCMVIELASTGYTEINGVYNLAANLSEDSVIDANDLGQVANLARAR